MTMTPPQLAIYKKILSAARTIGPLTEDPNKTFSVIGRSACAIGVRVLL